MLLSIYLSLSMHLSRFHSALFIILGFILVSFTVLFQVSILVLVINPSSVSAFTVSSIPGSNFNSRFYASVPVILPACLLVAFLVFLALFLAPISIPSSIQESSFPGFNFYSRLYFACIPLF